MCGFNFEVQQRKNRYGSGLGHDRNGVRLDTAQQHAGNRINDVTDNLAIDALCEHCSFQCDFGSG